MTSSWNFRTPRSEGTFTRQAHVNVPEGTFPRSLGRDGFRGPVVDFYHRNPPSAWSSMPANIQPALVDANRADITSSPWDGAELAINEDVRIRFWRTDRSMDHLARNVDGDELLFVHTGSAELFCDWGHISLERGDYFLMPRAATWRVETDGQLELMLIEATQSQFGLPDVAGVLGQQTPHDPGVLDVPALDEAFRDQDRRGEWTVRVKKNGDLGDLIYPFNPLDAEGWQGSLFPIRLNVRDIRPIHSYRTGLVPSAYATFVADNVVICTMVPYPGPEDPGAMKLPAFHDNVEYDELMFMHDGATTHRTADFRPGAMTIHPRGFPHGPQPAALALAQSTEKRDQTNTFVLIETRNPIRYGRDSESCSVDGYSESWIGSVEFAPDAAKN